MSIDTDYQTFLRPSLTSTYHSLGVGWISFTLGCVQFWWLNPRLLAVEHIHWARAGSRRTLLASWWCYWIASCYGNQWKPSIWCACRLGRCWLARQLRKIWSCNAFISVSTFPFNRVWPYKAVDGPEFDEPNCEIVKDALLAVMLCSTLKDKL